MKGRKKEMRTKTKETAMQIAKTIGSIIIVMLSVCLLMVINPAKSLAVNTFDPITIDKHWEDQSKIHYGRSYRESQYRMQTISPMEAGVGDAYVDPITGENIVKRNDMYLPGINRLDFNLERFYTDRNPYVGQVQFITWGEEYKYTQICLAGLGRAPTACNCSTEDDEPDNVYKGFKSGEQVYVKKNKENCFGNCYYKCDNKDCKNGKVVCSNTEFGLIGGEHKIGCTQCKTAKKYCGVCDNAKTLKCAGCDGKGQNDCIKCNKGYYPCSNCDGVGKYACGKCDGVGNYDCIRCDNGTYDCSRCDGVGEYTRNM